MAISPNTNQVAQAYEYLKNKPVTRWTVETALKIAMNCDAFDKVLREHKEFHR